jgi:hypothetical protein
LHRFLETVNYILFTNTSSSKTCSSQAPWAKKKLKCQKLWKINFVKCQKNIQRVVKITIMQVTFIRIQQNNIK